MIGISDSAVLGIDEDLRASCLLGMKSVNAFANQFANRWANEAKYGGW